MFQTQKGSRRFKRIENRNGVFALLVSSVGQTCDETVMHLSRNSAADGQRHWRQRCLQRSGRRTASPRCSLLRLKIQNAGSIFASDIAEYVPCDLRRVT